MLKGFQIVLFICLGVELNAQHYSNSRFKNKVQISDTVKLDTLSIIPSSVRVYNDHFQVIDTSSYKMNYDLGLLLPKKTMLWENKVISIQYRVFPLQFGKEYYIKDQKKFISADSMMGLSGQKYIVAKSSIKPFGDMVETSGSISRSLSFGNSQDIVLNSALNLQVKGELSEGINIEGAISDRTIPFQPQGNTQRLEEFDRIYLRAYTSKFDIKAGDVIVNSSSSRFLRYSRSVQGLDLTINSNLGSQGDSTFVQVSGAVSKGKYSRNSYIGVEGNQGPYKLTGAEGEQYIIVIAGSEKVYLDGILLTRGETNHYIIDYNTGELFFTPLVRITGNSRINIEFEYTEKSYARFILSSNVEQRLNNWTLRFSAFSESDSKNQPYNQKLSDDQIIFLQGLGDRIDQAIIPQADSVAYDSNKILYERVDTLVDGISYSIYKHSINPSVAIYQVDFSLLGEGKGNYTPDYSGANGRVYIWVAPVNGKAMGSYDPVKVLSTPKIKQMATLFVEKQLANQGYINSEIALSKNDVNTFSSIDKRNDIGTACSFNLRKTLAYRDSTKKSWLETGIRITSADFSQIDRYHDIEFERDWNIDGKTNGSNEKEGSIGVGFRTTNFYIYDNLDGLILSDNYKGARNRFQVNYKTLATKNELNFSSLYTDDTLKTSTFSKVKLVSELTKGKFCAGVNIEGEDNSQKDLNSGRILPSTYRWYEAKIIFGNPDSLKNGINISYKVRKDWRARDSILRNYSFAQDVGLNLKLTKNDYSKLVLFSGYRIFKPIDTTLAQSIKKENTLLNRLDYSFSILKGFVSSSINYEIGSGLENKYQFFYIEVPAGQGIYKWIDYNSNGVKEIDEFEIASFQDEAKYIRINLPSNQYIVVNSNALNASVDLRLEKIVNKTSKFSLFMKRLSNQFSISARQKNKYNPFFKSINPFLFDIYDSNLVSTSNSYRNSLAFNRFNRRLGFELVTNGMANKQVLANGYEIANTNSNQIIGWVGVTSEVTFKIDYQFDTKTQKSEHFLQRNYSIKRDGPSFIIRYTNMFGFNAEVKYEYEVAKNTSGYEESKKHLVSSELSRSIQSKSFITLDVGLSKVNYTGVTSTPLEYELLKGFKAGTNATWGIKYKRKISNYFEMDIAYNGRYISGSKIVHTGNMEVRAIF